MRWSSKRLTLGSIANLCLIGTAVFMVWSTVRGRANEQRAEPAVLFDWEGEFDAGVVMGPTDAPLHIIELMDFQLLLPSHDPQGTAVQYVEAHGPDGDAMVRLNAV